MQTQDQRRRTGVSAPQLPFHLPFDQRHGVYGIAWAGGRFQREDFVDSFAGLPRSGATVVGGGVLFQIFAALGAGDGDDVIALCQDPGQRKLRGLAAFLAGDFFDAAHQVQILLEVFALEARGLAAVVVGGEVFEAAELAG